MVIKRIILVVCGLMCVFVTLSPFPATAQIDTDDSVYAVAWHPMGTYFATGHKDRTVKIWNAQTHDLVNTFVLVEGIYYIPMVTSLDWSPDGEKLAVSATYFGGTGSSVWILDAETGQIEGEFDGGHLVNSVAWSPDGSTLAFGRNIGKTSSVAHNWVKLVDIETNQVSTAFEWGWGMVTSIAWNPEGNRLAASYSHDEQVSIYAAPEAWAFVWDVDSQETLFTLAGHSGFVSSVDWNWDGSKIATADHGDSIFMWDGMTGQLHTTLPIPNASYVIWHPSRDFLAVGGYKIIQIWDVIKGKEVYSLDISDYDINDMA
ncbi:MAG: PD40 domain-containing protein [Anaerolineae bacterium]|nr:PD40 domain-containing protein [Anaerolineae bacterium]